MDDNLLSIITPSYKSKKFINSTIQSVLAQTYTNFEMLIVDDCSPDGSADYIESILPDERFKLIRLNKNVGAAEARNVALQEANGRFIAFLDSDDTWYPSKLKIHLDYHLEYDIAFTFSSYDLIDENSKLLNKTVIAPTEICLSQYLKNTIIGCLTVVIDKEKIQKFTMPNLKSSHDMALWADILRNNNIKAYGIPKTLASYRLVSTSNTANKYKAAKDVWKVYRTYLKINTLKSCWYFSNYAFNAIKKRI